ncbi:MAG: UvrD-helicase domain-containing protein [Bacteroidota bacterium]
MEFLNELNETQREAVMSVDGPLMVIAGAGSGKTRVLTYRLAFILSQGLADPQELLALTFTNKAAREMKDRIYRLVGAEAKGIQMGTFHSIFSRILRAEAEKIGYTRAYTIYDDSDSISLIKDILKGQGIDEKVFKPRNIYNQISSNKNKLITPAAYKELVYDEFQEKTALVYALYQTRCLQANAMDFGDLLMKPVQLFQAHPDVLLKYQHRFQYLMVDEYQDTNHVQYMLCKMLAAVHENICVVGDDAQSIYAFRGANIENILSFERDYPEAKVVKLEQNYRSTQAIVNAANSIIVRNKDQIQKKVYSENEFGDLIKVVVATSEQDEAKRVCNMIREQKQMENHFNKDFAILYRTNSQSRALEDELRRTGIKYKVYGGLSFYQRKEIKDTAAYLRLAINPQDETALKRVINYPTRGIGKTTLNKLTIFADNLNLSFWEALKVADQLLKGRALTAIQNFVTLIESFGVVAKRHDAYEAANHMAKESGILKELHGDNTTEGLSRWENVQELLNGAKEYVENPTIEDETLEGFMAEIALFTDADKNEEDDDHVNLMTIHSAKGLEFKSVFVVGMEENIFPSSLSETRKELEEERRLFYVAVTRAEKSLTLSLARSRYRYGKTDFNEPSRFLEEIDPAFVNVPSQPSRSRRGAVPSGGTVKPMRRNLRPVSRVQGGGYSNFEASDPEAIKAGMEVLHQKFGAGKVIAVEGAGAQRKATVFFQSKGQRVLLLKYAKLQILT